MKKKPSNIAEYLVEMAEKIPDKKAIIVPKWKGKGFVREQSLTFKELDQKSNRYASALINTGIKKGDRVLLMLKPGIEFTCVTFSLFKIGAVPVLIDPGMGITRLLNCIRQVKPDGVIAVPIVHWVKNIKKKDFISAKHFVVAGNSLFLKGKKLSEMEEAGNNTRQPFTDINKTDPAAIVFTSGSTGIPKGVLYLHGIFSAQVEHIRNNFHLGETDIDMPGFPLFGLFGAALGMTSVIPDMNPAKPARINPKMAVKLINQYQVTTSFGSPALWDTVGKYCQEKNLALPTLKTILMAGAPVRDFILERFRDILSKDAEIYTPYGATEALPVSIITAKERYGFEEMMRKGAGTCVGFPMPGITVKIIKITDHIITVWDDTLVLGRGEKGEIVVTGDIVTQEYYQMEEPTKKSKILNKGDVWHRMGDIGYLDSAGRLWFCGRKTHMLKTEKGDLYSINTEAVFNQHPLVFRSALAGVGRGEKKEPVIIIEPKDWKPLRLPWVRKKIIKELRELGRGNKITKDIRHFLFYPSFPVDIRHNIKIDREKLSTWAEGKLKRKYL